MTDRQGRFVFQTVAAGSYSLRVTAPSYLDGGFGRAPGSRVLAQINLQAGQWFGDANAVLWRPASISGSVRDELDDPLVDVPVRILVAVTVGGRDYWALVAATQTDDLGSYRFAGLLPGRYVVQVPSIQITLPDGEVALYRSRKPVPLPAIRWADGIGTTAGFFAVPPAGHGQLYPTTFCPATRSLSTAEVLVVDFGSQRRSADVSLLPASSVRVSGVVAGPPATIANLPVRLLVAGNESLGFGGEIALTKTDSTGRFTLAQVPQGNYTVVVGRGLNELQIQAPDGIQPFLAPNNNWGANPFLDRISATPVIGEPGLSLFLFGMAGDGVAGRVSISVGTEAVEGLVVSTTVGATVSGRILYDGVDPAANDQGMRIGRPLIRLDPADGDISRVATSSTWDFTSEIGPAGPTFSIPNVMPGRYWFLGGDRSNRIVGATWNGRDLFATPLEVTGEGPVGDVVLRLSSKRNSVSGVIRASDSEVPSPGIVLIFPQNRNIWPEPGISAPLFRELEVSATGSFSVENLIPGDYFIVAFALESRKRGLDIGFLQSLAAQAKRITVDESARVTVELKLIGGRR